MRRRAVLGLLSGAGGLALAGCTGIFGDETESETTREPVDTKTADTPSDSGAETPVEPRPQETLPAECPVSTVAGYTPPDEPSRKSVESFIRSYEEAYMLQEQFLSYEDELTEAVIQSVEQTEYGYVVEANFSGSDVFLQAAVRAEPVDKRDDAADFAVLDSQPLVETARRAVDEQTAVTTRLSPPQGETEAETLPAKLQRQVEALPGDDGGYITVDGTTVRLRVEVREVHADFFTYSVLYYIDSRVVRRRYLPEADQTARDGQIVECR